MENGSSGEAYNLCSGIPISLRELSEMIRDILIGQTQAECGGLEPFSFGDKPTW